MFKNRYIGSKLSGKTRKWLSQTLENWLPLGERRRRDWERREDSNVYSTSSILFSPKELLKDVHFVIIHYTGSLWGFYINVIYFLLDLFISLYILYYYLKVSFKLHFLLVARILKCNWMLYLDLTGNNLLNSYWFYWYLSRCFGIFFNSQSYHLQIMITLFFPS